MIKLLPAMLSRIKDFIEQKNLPVGLEIRENVIWAFSSDKRFSIAIPPDSIKDGFISDPEKIAGALKQLWAKNKIISKKVSIAVSGNEILLHIVTLPHMPDSQIGPALQSKVNQYIAFAGVKTVFGWEKVGEVFEAGERRIRVLLAAAKRELVDSYISAVEKAGLQVNAITFPALAALRAARPESNKLFAQVENKRVDLIVLAGLSVLATHSLEIGKAELIAADINRMISSCGKEIKKIILSCSGPEAKEIASRLSRDIHLPVEPVTDLVGVGLSQSGDFKINLLPEEIRRAEEWRSQISLFLFSVTGLSLFMLTLFFVFYLGSMLTESRIAAVEKELSRSTGEFAQMTKNESEINKIRQLIAGRKKLIETIGAFQCDDILKELTLLVPKGVYLTDVVFTPENKIFINGAAEASDVVLGFVRRLKGAKRISGIDLKSIKQAEAFAGQIVFSIQAESKINEK